ncbi:alpha/beta hydrolase [Cryobacterium sp.]|jgi:pimeloyl-ACP methyl ester carboxylesterase|uniref:alpha/beta fold hydrolase n=1 Tax=Cryobacterium sp. TaxID=1926290 RepID=UPI002620552E|nr:alpha/beta hydrolase [Cryobacterium sp.]MCU1444552.1 alpha/beta hydrolase [Cryobacterium sp.]
MREVALTRTGASANVLSTVGDPIGPVFVLVHGIGMSHRYLASLHRDLARSGTVHSVDLPGFGRSPKPADGVSIEQYADYLGELIPLLSARPAVLVGHSMGAQFVVETAARYPELVSHLALIGAVTDPARATVLRQALDLARDTLKEPLSGNLTVFTDYIRCGPRWYLATLRPMLAYRTDLRLKQVDAPTLVIRGERDPVSRHGWAAYLAARPRDGRLLELPGRHLVQLTSTVATAEGIREHVGVSALIAAAPAAPAARLFPKGAASPGKPARP